MVVVVDVTVRSNRVAPIFLTEVIVRPALTVVVVVDPAALLMSAIETKVVVGKLSGASKSCHGVVRPLSLREGGDVVEI